MVSSTNAFLYQFCICQHYRVGFGVGHISNTIEHKFLATVPGYLNSEPPQYVGYLKQLNKNTAIRTYINVIKTCQGLRIEPVFYCHSVDISLWNCDETCSKVRKNGLAKKCPQVRLCHETRLNISQLFYEHFNDVVVGKLQSQIQITCWRDGNY